MADMSAIGGAVASLKLAGEIAKSLLGIRDAAMMQSKIVELQTEIVAAQHGALAAQSAEFVLLQRIRELETEMTKVKAWDAEKQRYHLTDVGLGSLAYSLKPEAHDPEPPHAICPSCYQRGMKSILQKDAEWGYELLRCHECRAQFRVKSTPVAL